jgi:dUTP pyrophosphatase
LSGVDVIELRGLSWFGYHGAFAEEQRLGQRFIVDLRLGLSLAAAGTSDDLDQTVDYGRVAETVRAIVEGPPFKLIEALAESVASAILAGFPLVERADVRIAQPSAPVPTVSSGLIAVEIQRTRTHPSLADSLRESVNAHAEPGNARVEAGPHGAVLTAAGIRELQRRDPPLIEPLSEPEIQIQPNGVDLTLESVWCIVGTGTIGRSNDDRVIPDRLPIDPDSDGWLVLSPGTYIIRLREVVALPLDVMAFGRPRSSLLRCGAAIHTAVWDAGYRGRSEALLVVTARDGIRLAPGARVLQLVFCRLDAPTHAYAGAYQGENLATVAANGSSDGTVAGSQ